MKRLFFRIIPLFLLIAFLPLANNFCFQNFLGLKTAVREASAATYDASAAISAEDCLDQAAADDMTPEEPSSSRHGVYLLCCLDITHPDLIAGLTLAEIEKTCPAPTISFLIPLEPEPEIKAGPEQKIPSPRLLSIKTTVLRL